MDWHHDREGNQEADEELPAAAGIFELSSPICVCDHKMPADVGDEPEAIEAEGRDLQETASQQDAEEVEAGVLRESLKSR
jgi:hypothetical protein